MGDDDGAIYVGAVQIDEPVEHRPAGHTDQRLRPVGLQAAAPAGRRYDENPSGTRAHCHVLSSAYTLSWMPERSLSVVVFSGGRGSSVLSRELIANPRIDLTLAINCYDD